MPLFFFAKLTSLMVQKEESNMKTVYAVIGAATVTLVTFTIGVGYGAYALGKLGMIETETEAGKSLNEAIAAIDKAKEHHGPLS